MPYPGSADLRKGGFVEMDPTSATVRCIVAFQYNPEELRRSLVARRARLPREIITCVLTLDATDALQYADENRGVVEHGVNPSLAALELLLRPAETPAWRSWLGFLAPRSGAQSHKLVIFAWGDRCVPVRLTRLQITETQHDLELHPIRATAKIRMHVLTDPGVPRGHHMAALWSRPRLWTESLASLASVASLEELGYGEL